MKITKVNKPPLEEKSDGLKYGKVKKSVGAAAPKKKLRGLTAFKTSDHLLNILESNELVTDLKKQTKKEKNVALAANKASKTKASNRTPGFKGEKTKKGKHPVTSISGGTLKNSGSTFEKIKNKITIQSDVENNTSPIKATKENRKIKIPLQIDSSLSAPFENDVARSPKGNKSPEVILGLQLEKALSPKSKKEKKKLKLKQKLLAEGKVEVSKKDVENKNSEEATNLKKKRKRRRRRSKKQHLPELPAASLFEIANATNALKALLKTSKASKSEKKELFGEDKFIYLQCNLLKGTEMSKSVLHIPLPHLILPQPFEVCLITPDLKGKRNDPEEAIDFYKDLLKKNNIDYISEIIPIRKLKKEYTSFEQRRNLANRFDAILADGRISKLARIGRRFAPTKKCISTVHFGLANLKQEFDKSLRKIAMFCQGKGLSLSIKCGRDGMSVNDIAENIMAIGKHLANDKIVIGNVKNISSVYIKTALSPSFPIYVSTFSPNDVSVPEGKKRKVEESVEDEVTTVLGGTVVVHPSGNVKVKKQKVENLDSDDEFLQHKKKTSAKNNKTSASSNKENSESEGDIDLESNISDELHSGVSEEEGIDSEDIFDTRGKEVEGTDDDESGSESDDFEEKLVAAEGIDSEDNTDASEMEDEGTDDAESDESGSESDDFEEKIAAAEREYLQEVRQLQDGIAKKKKIFMAKAPQGKTKKYDKTVQLHAEKNEMHPPKKSEINEPKPFKKGSNKQVPSKELEIIEAAKKKQDSSLGPNKKIEIKEANQRQKQTNAKKPAIGVQKQGRQKMPGFEKDNQKEINKFSNGISLGNKKLNEKVAVKGNKSVKENKFDSKITLNKPGKSKQKGKKLAQPLKAVNQQLSEPALNKKHKQKKGKAEADGESKFSGKKRVMGGKIFKS